MPAFFSFSLPLSLFVTNASLGSAICLSFRCHSFLGTSVVSYSVFYVPSLSDTLRGYSFCNRKMRSRTLIEALMARLCPFMVFA